MKAEEITAGPDGNLWFSYDREIIGSPSYIGKLTPEGKLTEYKLPETEANIVVGGITPGP